MLRLPSVPVRQILGCLDSHRCSREVANPRKEIMQFIAGIVVAAFGLFLIGLAALCIFRRSAAERFLSGFASSARAHFTEHTIRFIVGAAFVISAPSTVFPSLFLIFGWVLVVTSAVLLVLPWRWHREYARRTVPIVLRWLWAFAFSSLALGLFVLYGLTGLFQFQVLP